LDLGACKPGTLRSPIPQKAARVLSASRDCGSYRTGNFERRDERKKHGQASAVGEVSCWDAMIWMTAVVSSVLRLVRAGSWRALFRL